MPWTAVLQAPLCTCVPDKNIGVGCHFLLQDFTDPGIEPPLLYWMVGSLPLSHLVQRHCKKSLDWVIFKIVMTSSLSKFFFSVKYSFLFLLLVILISGICLEWLLPDFFKVSLTIIFSLIESLHPAHDEGEMN